MKLLLILIVLWFVSGMIFTVLSVYVKSVLRIYGINTINFFTTPFSDLKKLKSINTLSSNLKVLYLFYKIVNYITLLLFMFVLLVTIILIITR